MRKALISDRRIAQVEDEAFPVAAPLLWVDCADDVTPQTHYYDGGIQANPVIAPTLDEIKSRLMSAVQAHLDSAARARNYDNIFTAVTYADEPAVPTFQAEGQALRQWRSLVWDKCYQILADVQAGTRTIPTEDGLIAELPALTM